MLKNTVNISSKNSKFFVKSLFLHSIRKRNQYLIWHSLFGNPIIVNKDAYKYLEIFSTPQKIETISKLYKDKKSAFQLLGTYLKIRFINPIGFDDRVFLEKIINRRIKKGLNGSFIDYLELRVSEICNYNCSYCILQNAGRIKDKKYKKYMEFNTAKRISRYICKPFNKKFEEES